LVAAVRLGIAATLVVPYGNSREKNRAMAAFGGRLVEAGHDFQAAYEHAVGLAEREGLHLVPSFHPLLVRGVASYGLELFRAAADAAAKSNRNIDDIEIGDAENAPADDCPGCERQRIGWSR
jgi:threonine dehydratase